jgi:hypothetical protein
MKIRYLQAKRDVYADREADENVAYWPGGQRDEIVAFWCSKPEGEADPGAFP